SCVRKNGCDALACPSGRRRHSGRRRGVAVPCSRAAPTTVSLERACCWLVPLRAIMSPRATPSSSPSCGKGCDVKFDTTPPAAVKEYELSNIGLKR
ncbi:Protein of unknown function, partial [Gryllus bimaculatus]